MLLAVILAVSCVALTGCFGIFDVSVSGVSFVSDGKPLHELTLSLGEETELNRYVSVTPAKAKNKAFTIKSDDESVVKITTKATSGSVSRIYASAVGVGETTLTVTTDDGGKTATVTASVSYAAANSVKICPDDSLTAVWGTVILYAADLAPSLAVRFTASLGEYADPAHSVQWKATGNVSEDIAQELPADTAFSFTPAGVGRSTVTASVSDGENTYTDTVYVNVYSQKITDAQLSHTGSLDQSGNNGVYETVTAELTYESAPEDPAPVIVWKVWQVQDTERTLVAEAAGASYGFTPSAPGKYEIEGTLNGESAGKIELKARGTILPQNVWLDYDNCYPEVWVRWDAVSAAVPYAVSVKNARTGLEVASDLNSRNTAIRDKFTSSGFNATQWLTGDSNIFNTQFIVQVKTLADTEGLFGESEWSEQYTSAMVPNAAKPYLEKSFYDGARNYYVRSYEEFYEWFEYAMLWRPSDVSSDSGEKLYLDYAFGRASDVIDTAMHAMHFTGNYRYEGGHKGKECTFRILFDTDGTPSKRNVSDGDSWDAMRPHVNYDPQKARPSGYKFPIDDKTPVTVETSEQLYYMAQPGYRPVPKSGSVAERLYTYARNVLRYIVTDDMTDAEKLHALYDWILWRVLYNDTVLRYTTIADAVQYEAYYLESVFTDSYYYGVCDAMSKAYALMANIEGFACLRVTGEAGERGNRGGHAWNKVQLHGQWYIVDCTWGDVSTSVISGGASKESASHIYFLLADGDVADTHVEDEGSSFPRTAATRYPWYKETEYADGVDLYVENTASVAGRDTWGKPTYEVRQDMQNELNALAAYMAQDARASGKTYTVGNSAVNTYADYYGYEFVLNGAYYGNDEKRAALQTAWQKAMQAQGLAKSAGARFAANEYTAHLSEMGGNTHVLVYINL